MVAGNIYTKEDAQAMYLIRQWLTRFGLSHWKVTTERISVYQVSDDDCGIGSEFVGVSIDNAPYSATIHHTRKLTEEDIIHELLHVRHPEWSEEQVNLTTHLLIQQKEKAMKFYNVKLKKSVEVDEKDVKLVTMKNGRPAAKASVEIDGVTHNMFKIIDKADAAKLSS